MLAWHTHAQSLGVLPNPLGKVQRGQFLSILILFVPQLRGLLEILPCDSFLFGVLKPRDFLGKLADSSPCVVVKHGTCRFSDWGRWRLT
jgi:hypothetical protein